MLISVNAASQKPAAAASSSSQQQRPTAQTFKHIFLWVKSLEEFKHIQGYSDFSG
jgi:hypothetical protein